MISSKTLPILTFTILAIQMNAFATGASVLDPKIQSVLGQASGRWGPNCWNSVLVNNRILSHFRFSPPEEMTFWMKSPLCKPVLISSDITTGDILAIRSSTNEEIHGFIYLDSQQSFSKDTLTTSSSYEIKPITVVLNSFEVASGCSFDSSVISKDCKNHVDVFRCTGLQDNQKSWPASLKNRYDVIETQLAALETKIDFYAFNWKKDPKLKDTFYDQTSSLNADIKKWQKAILVQKAKTEKKWSWVWEGLTLKTTGLQKTIDMF